MEIKKKINIIMRLNVHFKNVSRPRDVQTQIECTFKGVLLDLCDSPETVFKVISQYNSNPRNFTSDWPRFYRVAFNLATKNLSTKEKSLVYPIITFT